MELLVLPVLSDDIHTGAVWLPARLVGRRRLVRIENKTQRMSAYCEAIPIGESFIRRYNKQADVPIPDAENCVIMSHWYRAKLGLEQQEVAALAVLDVTGGFASIKSCLQHPQIVVRLATVLGVWSFVPGAVGVVLGVLGMIKQLGVFRTRLKGIDMRYPFASMLIAELGPSMGISVELEPEYNFAGELVFPNGKRHLFRNTNFNINVAGSTEIAKDKSYTNFFLRKHGFRVPNGRAFFSDKLNANLPFEKRRNVSDAVSFATELGFPVFVKPNNLSQGAFVTKAYVPSDITSTANQIFSKTEVLLLEQACPGRDYRVVVLGEKIISAYERVPLSVTGDGARTIDELLVAARASLDTQGRPNSEIDPADPRINIKLRELKRSRATVLARDEKVALLDNANLSTGGTSVDVTDSIHSSFCDVAIAATKTLGLRLSGVDILCNDITKSASNQDWNIIEVNAAPGLDNYSALGAIQAERVKSLYKQILEYLAAHDAQCLR